MEKYWEKQTAKKKIQYISSANPRICRAGMEPLPKMRERKNKKNSKKSNKNGQLKDNCLWRKAPQTQFDVNQEGTRGPDHVLQNTEQQSKSWWTCFDKGDRDTTRGHSMKLAKTTMASDIRTNFSSNRVVNKC